MKDLFQKYGIALNDCQIGQFERYYELLTEYNKKFNITSISDKDEVIVKHFLDSAIVVDKLCGKKLIDIGSGGGFPAIPIKIVSKNTDITMVEATGKKCEFLKICVKELNLDNVTVINARAEDLAKKEEYREKFDICTARAVARLNTLCEYCMPFVKINGNFIALKSNAEQELKESENAIKLLGGNVDKVLNYNLENNNRTLIFIKKLKATDKKYPRGQGKERKNPL